MQQQSGVSVHKPVQECQGTSTGELLPEARPKAQESLSGARDSFSCLAVDIVSLEEQPCVSGRIYPYLCHASCQPGFPRSPASTDGAHCKALGKRREGDLSLSSTTSAGFQEPWY